MKHEPGRHPGQHGPVPAAGHRGTGEHHDRGQRMCDRALAVVPQQPQIERDVIKVDGHRGDQRGDIEPPRRIGKTRQDHQAQGRGGQMGNLVERPGAQQAK